MRIEIYQDKYKDQWNSFVEESKNGTFLHNRDYMEYHKDRFKDFSLMIFDENTLTALLPANIVEDKVYSHQGLTYGGLIITKSIGQICVNEIFAAIFSFLKDRNISTLYYKTIPQIYHKMPSDEDLYSLFCVNAELADRKASSAIFQNNKPEVNKRRKRGSSRAEKRGVRFSENSDIRLFWDILTENLNIRYGNKPVHNLSEITSLVNLFPDNIICHTVEIDNEVVAGVLLYKTETCVHAQYISSSEKGKKNNALDFLFDKLINDVYNDIRWFDFGTSTEPYDTKVLNEGLITQKEYFGACTIVYDTYVVDINRT